MNMGKRIDLWAIPPVKKLSTRAEVMRNYEISKFKSKIEPRAGIPWRKVINGKGHYYMGTRTNQEVRAYTADYLRDLGLTVKIVDNQHIYARK